VSRYSYVSSCTSCEAQGHGCRVVLCESRVQGMMQEGCEQTIMRLLLHLLHKHRYQSSQSGKIPSRGVQTHFAGVPRSGLTWLSWLRRGRRGRPIAYQANLCLLNHAMG